MGCTRHQQNNKSNQSNFRLCHSRESRAINLPDVNGLTGAVVVGGVTAVAVAIGAGAGVLSQPLFLQTTKQTKVQSNGFGLTRNERARH